MVVMLLLKEELLAGLKRGCYPELWLKSANKSVLKIATLKLTMKSWEQEEW